MNDDIGYVYFAKRLEPWPSVKIGWSEHPEARVASLSAESGATVKLIRRVAIARSEPLWGVGSNSLESFLHRILAARRVDPSSLSPSDRGEWYRLTEEDLDHVVAAAHRLAFIAGWGPQ